MKKPFCDYLNFLDHIKNRTTTLDTEEDVTFSKVLGNLGFNFNDPYSVQNIYSYYDEIKKE